MPKRKENWEYTVLSLLAPTKSEFGISDNQLCKKDGQGNG